MRQLPLPVQLRASSLFASFYAGPNRPLVDQLRALAPQDKPTVIWMYGPAGSGKTHLLQSVCACVGGRGWTAGYLPLADAAILPEVLIGCDSLNFVCLDDFERVAGNAEWERGIFRLYGELEESGGRLLIAATERPANIGVKLKDLASRLSAGTTLRLQALDDDEQVAALRLRAEHLGFELTEEVAQFMLRRLPRDMTRLCATLDRLDRESLASQRRLTIPFVRAALESATSN